MHTNNSGIRDVTVAGNGQKRDLSIPDIPTQGPRGTGVGYYDEKAVAETLFWGRRGGARSGHPLSAPGVVAKMSASDAPSCLATLPSAQLALLTWPVEHALRTIKGGYSEIIALQIYKLACSGRLLTRITAASRPVALPR